MRKFLRKPHLVIAGNGMAAGRLVDELFKRNPNCFDITIIGKEPEGSYNRIMLSPVLAGELCEKRIIQKDAKWYRENNIRFAAGSQVAQIYTDTKHIRLVDGHNIFFDELVIATGSSPAKIPARNQELDNIYSFRTLRDVKTINTSAQDTRNAIVIGGGLLGLEAAHGLALKGINVTVIHRSNGLMNRQLDTAAAAMLQNVMEQRNIQFKLNTEVVEFLGRDRVKAARLTSGETISCDITVIATGITPNAELARDAELDVNKGIIVDSFMRTSNKRISALGECCEFEGNTFGLVEPIWDQCITLAERLINENEIPFTLKPIPTKLKVSGVQLFSAGEHITRPEYREIVIKDPAHNIYRKLLLNNQKIVGCVLFGDVRDGLFYYGLMQQNIPVSEHLPHLIFGHSWCHGISSEMLSPSTNTTATSDTSINAA